MLESKKIGYLILRIGLGINLFAHGLVRLISNSEKFQEWLLNLFAPTIFPVFSIKLMANIIPPLEFWLGIAILLGIKFKIHLIIGALLMFSLIFGMCMVQQWEIVGFQMIYLIFYYFLITHIESNSIELIKG